MKAGEVVLLSPVWSKLDGGGEISLGGDPVPAADDFMVGSVSLLVARELFSTGNDDLLLVRMLLVAVLIPGVGDAH